MKRLNRNFWLCLAGPAVAVLGACSSKPISSAKVDRALESSEAQRVPVRVFTNTEHMLRCVGLRLAEAQVPPLLIGFELADSSGKTGTDLNLPFRAGLHKVVSGGANLSITTMGAATQRPESRAVGAVSAEGQARTRMAANPDYALAAPDIVFEGGVSSAPAGALYKQRGGGVSGRDVDGGLSRSASVDLAFVHLAVKRFRNGVDVPGAMVSLRVTWQQGSSSVEAGAYVSWTLDGNRSGVGVRVSSSSGFAESPEEALTVGLESALAMLMAQLYGIELATCPAQIAPRRAGQLDGQSEPPAPNQVWAMLERMSQTERIRWLQQSLAAQKYDPGPVDGLIGPRTRSAIAAFERDHGLPPGGNAGMQVLVAMARVRLAAGDDPRQPAALASMHPLRITLDRSDGRYAVGQAMRARVVVPRAGHLQCHLVSPSGKPMGLYPLADGRGSHVGAGSPVLLPSYAEGAGAPTVVLNDPGAYSLYCAQTRLPIAPRPAAPGSLPQLQAELRRAAGTGWLGDGIASFHALPRP